MKSHWNEIEAKAFDGVLGPCVYASKLLGAEPTLVLHGGGNTSIKTVGYNVHGDPIDVLWVKASGWDLADIEAAGFTPLDLDHVRRLSDLDELPDLEMANELKTAKLDASAPNPSVEAMIHAIISDHAVQHTHSDALLAISNTDGGAERVRDLYGDRVVVVPYARSGFRVGKATADEYAAQITDRTIGIVLMNHGLFTFGSTHREAYERMIELVSEAEEHLTRSSSGGVVPGLVDAIPSVDRPGLASLRSEISVAAGRPMILSRHTDDGSWAFSQRPDLETLAGQGPATPDHVIWTKTLPMFGRDVTAYADRYESYYEENKHLATAPCMLDPAPRVIFDREYGMLTAGPNARTADAARDIYERTIWVIERATELGGYAALPATDFFDLEYWELEQAKLDRAAESEEFAGEVAVVTGAASGIGRACALELLDRGAAVVGLDVSASVVDVSDDASYLGVPCDLTSESATSSALDAAVERFGGVDMLVASAGLFPESAPIAEHDPAAWRKAMSVNVDAFVQLLELVHPLLALAPRLGRVAVVGSKNVAAPGPGASAYSASKAAANQIARVAALEWASDGIRINSVHPDAVFDTALWTDELLAERAARYGLTVEEYKRRNLLSIEITSADVAGIVATTLSPVFSTVTGAHIPIDGGSDRVI
ncbi:MAG: bifunctional aldolase/short-chain dehydrogenase [Actinomycetota bacterium]